MAFVRVSHMVPLQGKEAEVEDILRKLSEYYPTQPGFIAGWHLSPHEHTDTRRLGRVGVWETEDHAEAAAQSQHHMALRAELIRLVDEDSHMELTFEGTPD